MTASNTAQDLRQKREAVVWEHIRGERHGADLDGAIEAFHEGHATYDVVPFEHLKPEGQDVTHPTSADVRGHLAGLVEAFPDLWLEPMNIHHSDDAVIIEGRTTGTHLGPLDGLEPTGRRMDVRAAVFFRFQGEHMTNETVYMDLTTMHRQLGQTHMKL